MLTKQVQNMPYNGPSIVIGQGRLMFTINKDPKSAPLRYIRFQNLNDLDFDLSMSLKVPLDSPYMVSY